MRRITMSALMVLCVLPLGLSLDAQVLAGERAQDLIRRRDEAGRREEADFRRRMNDLQILERRGRLIPRKPLSPPIEPKLTSEGRARVLKLRHVNQADTDRYATLLRQKGTGIFKLFPDLGCMSKSVLRISGDCERFVPMSSAFTFRNVGYGDEMYHDMHFKDDRIISDSFFSQGIFSVIGDEPIEGIDLSHNALKYLVSFEPAHDPRIAADQADKFLAGVDSGGYKYTDAITPRENTTYAFRSVAYRLENNLSPISPETTMNEMMFHSLALDKRLDVVLVFRILGRDEYGGLTVVWKELDRKDAAKIKFAKNQVLGDFRPDVTR